MSTLFLRHRINKCISVIEQSINSSDLSDETLEFLYSPKNRKAMQILEASGCIKCTYAWGHHTPIDINVTKSGFSIYQLTRHDVWLNRFWGFISGLVVGILSALISQSIL